MIKGFPLMSKLIFLLLLSLTISGKPKKVPEIVKINVTYYPELEDSINKVKIGKLIHPVPQYDPTDPEDASPNKGIRKLATENTLTKAGFIPISDTGELVYSAYNYILKNVKTTQASMVLYPYSLSYTPAKEDGETQQPSTQNYKKGGFFELMPDNLPEGNFDFIKTNTDVKIGKAKALYDTNVAILKVETVIDKEGTDLFYESDYYGNYFIGYFGKTSSIIRGKDDFLEYHQMNPTKTAVVYYNHADIINDGLFTQDGYNNFGLLVVPDYVMGSEEIIKKLFTEQGFEKIKTFVKNGGTILASGKSGYLLESVGLVNKGTYTTEKLLGSGSADSSVKTTGFEDAIGVTPTTAKGSFEKQALSLGLSSLSYILSSFPMKEASVTNQFEVVASFSADQKLIFKSADNGVEEDLADQDKTFLPFILFKNVEKGRVIIFNGNPVFKTSNHYAFSNVLFLAMSKNVIFNGYVNFGEDNSLPIPGGEGGIKLTAKIEFLNLFDTAIDKYELHFYVKNKVDIEAKSLDSSCKLVQENQKDVELNGEKFNLTTHVKCYKDKINQFDKAAYDFRLEILDASVTQEATDILLFYPIAIYEDGGIRNVLDSTGIKVQAALAAILRGALNPDPSSFYPMLGKGAPADNVLQVENKENTVAKDVVYYGVVPLVSPLVDGNDQGSLAIMLEFYNQYYLDHRKDPNNGDRTFRVPMDDFGQNETIYFNELNNHAVTLVADWDQPVKITKEVGSGENIDDAENVNIGNAGYSTTIDNLQIEMQQIYFDKADQFYEHATQRLMPFVDVTTKEGFEFYYKGNAPEGMENPNIPGTGKKPVIFIRNDVYFYDSLSDYQMPEGIDETFIISIDNYPQSQQKCSETFGTAKNEVLKKGSFTHENGLIPNEWANLLFKTCNRKKYDPTTPEGIAGLGKDIKLLHYLVINKDEAVTRASDIRGFEEDSGDCTGYLKEYPVVKLIKAHGIDIKVPADLTRQGGKFVIKIDATLKFDVSDPVKEGYISYSADQVAFYKTEYKDGVITAYFKRGLMPNESNGKDSNIGIYIEHLKSSSATTKNGCVIQPEAPVTIELYEMKYDLSAKEAGYESYEFRKTYNGNLYFKPFYSLPSVEIATRMNRGGSTEIKEYELLMPYTRYGIYGQEILKHRTIYAYLEAHNVKDPGIVSKSEGFATISNVGISSIPFVEYVTHGSGLLIPGSPATSRLEWVDIWGRHWSQPLRSVFPDVPPIPPPLRNFIMTTTFELFDKNKKRILEWNSDEEAYIHVQMKFLNNYPKFFLSTTCPANLYPYEKGNERKGRERIFTTEPDFTYIPKDDSKLKNVDNKYLQFGFSSVYGKCFKEKGACLSGSKLSQSDFDLMDYAMTCSATGSAEELKKCVKKLEDVKTLKKKNDGDKDECDGKYNYSPSVESYYPKGFIKNNMWDLTHYDYDDNAMDKAYKYHMDNQVPGLDNSIIKPHNLATFPIFKGFGYKITYDKNLNIPLFPGYKGWWSDNLQNKDNTVLGGQAVSNDVSVGKPTLLPSSSWINYKDVVDESGTVKNRARNIYVCLYNQHRVKTSPGQKHYAYPNNVFQNNVVPIIPDLDENDDRLRKYKCDGVTQYTPENISQVDNIVETNSDRDWLYFAVNLRGGARENINILMKLEPFEDRKYEGITKVQDGGRFTYWNPANGPNSFLIVDNPVNTVEAKRVDLQVDAMILPTTTTTFNSELFQIFTVQDEKETLREYTLSTYTNSYGFGDSTVSVFVGGTKDTSCKVEPGKETYIKLVFYNNCGFDWNLLGEAIDFEERKSMAINANDLLSGAVHTVQAPLSYNFLTLHIPAEIKPYIEIVPSDHNIQTAAQFFDFENINVATIRDGFEADYFYKLTVKDNFPDELKGKLHSINVTINEKYFDQLPGPKDPTGIHDYTLKVPPFKFGVPYPESKGDGQAGKIYYTFGRGTDLAVTAEIISGITVEGIKFITEEEIEEFRKATSDSQNALDNMKTLYNSLPEDNKLTFTVDSSKNIFKADFSKTKYSTFPTETKGEPDITKFHFIVKTFAESVPYGYQPVITNAYVEYKDQKQAQKKVPLEAPTKRYVTAKGAWIKSSYSYQIMERGEALEGVAPLTKSPVQSLTASDEGYLQVNVTAKNTGSEISYNLRFKIQFGELISFLEEEFGDKYQYTLDGDILELNPDTMLIPGASQTIVLYFKYSPLNLRRLSEAPTSRVILKRIEAGLDLTENQGEISVSQFLDPFSIYFNTKNVQATVANSGSFYKPSFTVVATPDTELSKYKLVYQFKRSISGLDGVSPDFVEVSTKQDSNIFRDESLEVIIPSSARSYSVTYRVGVFKENNQDVEVAHINVKYQTTLKDVEEKKGGSSIPVWAYVVIVVLALALIVLGGILIYKKLTSKAQEHLPISGDHQSDVVMEKDGLSSTNLKGSIYGPVVRGEVIRVARYPGESNMIELQTSK